VKKYLFKVSNGPAKPFTYMDINHICHIKEFSIVEHTDIMALERQYTKTLVLQEKANRFPTEFVALRKQ